MIAYPRVLFRGGKDKAIIAIFTKNRPLLYAAIKLAGRLAINILCRRIRISHPELLKRKGPLLLAVNHPNSFLDSILLDLLFTSPVWALARGDAFRNKTHARLLRKLNILPVYRSSEGVANLSINYETFTACVDLFRQNKIVTIYSEALCVNEWHLRPLKKGTARLAIQTWEAGIPLTVLPVGLNYSSFRRFGKNVDINIGEPIYAQDITTNATDGQRLTAFNQLLLQRLQPLVYEIDKHDPETLQQKLGVRITRLEKISYTIPAWLGQLFHWPLYKPIQQIALHYFDKTVHYDSVVSSLLLLLYPIYLLLMAGLLWYSTHSFWAALALLIVAPFCAWCRVRIKPQFDSR
jgi:1-acyl-sn-glycerol-3-phosphate acyltransferase